MREETESSVVCSSSGTGGARLFGLLLVGGGGGFVQWHYLRLVLCLAFEVRLKMDGVHTSSGLC